MKQQFRIREAAQVLGIDVSHLYRLVRSGLIPVQGKHPLRITRKSLRRYVVKRMPNLPFIFPELLKKTGGTLTWEKKRY